MEDAYEWLYKKAGIITIAILVIVDRALKICAINTWAEVPLQLKPWLFLGLEKNRGIAWGMISSQSGYLQAIIIVLMIAALLAIAYRGVLEWCASRSPCAEILISIGGLSNLIDRIQYGAVVDFAQIFIGNYRLSVFNLADIYILVGLVLILRKTWDDEYF